jgi:hypothetical protein
MWALIRVLPQALKFVQSLLQKMSVEDTRQLLRNNAEKVKEIDTEHDDDPLGTTVDFFSGVRESDDSG